MKITVEWLKDYLETNATPNEIGDTLTMLGIECEGIEDSPLGPVLEIKVTPNRGDCLSVFGLARELAAKNFEQYKPTELFYQAAKGWSLGDENQTPSEGKVIIKDPDLCPRYSARIFKNIKPGPSSAKIQSRLEACGMRPISLLVDLTNYVMIEIGQPMHAFDLNKLKSKTIVVQKANNHKKITTLDNIERKLASDMLLICDAEDPIAIAGVMGGADSEVSNTTTEILLESAHFDPVSVRKTRRALGMSTEASYRFERYVDPSGTVRALNRFADLLKNECGIQTELGVHDIYPHDIIMPHIITRENKWNEVLGISIPKAAAASILNALGCKVVDYESGLQITPPTWRSDINIEEDVIEEIGRLWGYEHIPEELPAGATPLGGEDAYAAFRTNARKALIRLGCEEILSHTLRNESPLDNSGNKITLRNPGSPETALLRCSLLPGLAEAALRNRGRRLTLFECGRVFINDKERRYIAFLTEGRVLPEHWTAKESPVFDFFTVKGMIEAFGNILNKEIRFSPSSDQRFHPAQQAILKCDDLDIGITGKIETTIASTLSLSPETYVCEIDLDTLFECPSINIKYQNLSVFPSVRRDLAMSIDKSIPYETIKQCVIKSAGETLESVSLFDVYEGKGIEEGKHSIGISIVLRHSSHTLTDEEANDIRENVFEALSAIGAVRR